MLNYHVNTSAVGVIERQWMAQGVLDASVIALEQSGSARHLCGGGVPGEKGCQK